MAGEIVLAALRAILGALRPLKVQAVLVGGLGIQAWGRIRQTKDVDLLIGASGIDPGALQEAAERGGLFRDPAHAVVTLSGVTVMRFLHTDARSGISVHVDLLLASGRLAGQVLNRARPAVLFGEALLLATCEDLILMKLMAGRPIDRVDAAELIRLNAADLDLGYLRAEADRELLRPELDRLEQEARSGA